MGSGLIPGGLIQTAAHAAAAGLRRRAGVTKRRRRSRRTPAQNTRRAARKQVTGRSSGRKPKFGTKAWMAYIRGMRGKKRK